MSYIARHESNMATITRCTAPCTRPGTTPCPVASSRLPHQTSTGLVAGPSGRTIVQMLAVPAPKLRQGARSQLASPPHSLSTQGAPGAEDSKQFAIAMAKVADDIKCDNVMVLDVAPGMSPGRCSAHSAFTPCTDLHSSYALVYSHLHHTHYTRCHCACCSPAP